MSAAPGNAERGKAKGGPLRPDRVTVNARPLSILLVTTVVIALIVALSCAAVVLARGQSQGAYTRLALEQQLLIQQLHLDALSLRGGDERAGERLRHGVTRLDNNIALLRTGGPGVVPLPERFAPIGDALATRWGEARLSYRDLAERAATGRSDREQRARLDFQLEQAESVVASHLLKVVSEERETPAARAALVQIERDIAALRIALGGADGDPAEVAALRERLAERLGAVLVKTGSSDLALQHPGVREGLAVVRDSLAAIADSLDAAASRAATDLSLAPALDDQRAEMLANSQALGEALVDEQGLLDQLQLVAIIAGLVMLLALMLLAGLIWRSSSRQAMETVARSQRDQRAILRLLDEMADLADGDLRVRATVNEDITGAIADAINYAVESLRALVHTVGHSAGQVRLSVRRTEGNARSLVEATAEQAREIGTTSQALDATAANMRNSAREADRAMEVALASVDTATKGAGAVRHTVQAMGDIHRDIEETAQRLEHLNDSSREITSIVALIEEIAGRTSVLSVNASLKAEPGVAGDFARVAAEIQRLSEQVGDAARRVDEIVNHIQTDGQAALESMQRSTDSVAEGVTRAERAFGALGEIEAVSHQLASLIGDISARCNQQAQVVSNVSRSMSTIRNISQQAVAGTRSTADAIAELGMLSEQLDHSIAGFRMPERASSAPQRPVTAADTDSTVV